MKVVLAPRICVIPMMKIPVYKYVLICLCFLCLLNSFGFEMILWVSVVGFILFAVANTLVRPVSDAIRNIT